MIICHHLGAKWAKSAKCVLSRSHFLINVRQSGNRGNNPKSNNELVMGQNRTTLSPILPSKTQLRGVSRHFQAISRKLLQLAYYQSYRIDSHQILHSDKDHQMPFVGGPNICITNPKWRTAAILKNRKIAISQQRPDSSP